MGQFEDNNLGWQLQLATQRLVEWLERVISDVKVPSVNPSPDPAVPGWLIEGLVRFAQISLIVLVVLLGIQILVWLVPRFRRLRPTGSVRSAPAAPVLSRQEWLQQARHFQNQGNYREASRCLYLAMLGWLDQQGIVSQQASRTDAEYLSVLQVQPKFPAYQLVVSTHEQLFGTEPITAARFEQCRQALTQIESIQNETLPNETGTDPAA